MRSEQTGTCANGFGRGDFAVNNRQNNKNNYDHLIWNILPSIWRRRRLIYVAVIFTSVAASFIYAAVGERYEAYTLLRVGQGIKDRTTGVINAPLGEGIDLTSRLDSLARIGATDHVIQQAAMQVGPDRLLQGFETTLLAQLLQTAPTIEFLQPLYNLLPEKKKIEPADGQPVSQELTGGLRNLISAKQEGRSDLLRIAFRYPNPEIAADYLNKLANSLVATQADLVQVPGAETFFEQQAKRLEQEAEKAAADLQNFSVSASIYSVGDQRGLLLKRASELAASMATTRSAIEERKGQKQAILDQLQVLKPVTQSRTVSAMVNSLAGPEFRSSAGQQANSNFDDTPPLLLVRLYQDAMAALLKVNSDLSGYIKVERMIRAEIEQVNAELASLSSKESEYDRLKRILTRASASAEHYATRMGEEQISSDIAKKTQLSNVRVVQVAESPINPLFPTIMHLAVLAVLGGIMMGSALIVMLELLRARLEHEDEEEIDITIDDFGKHKLRRSKPKITAAE